MIKSRKPKIAFLVTSCDKYEKLWNPFMNLLFENWKNLLEDVYLMTNFKNFHEHSVRTLNIGHDKSWSENLLTALAELKEYDYVFLMMEDMFLSKNIDGIEIDRIFNEFCNIDGDFLTLMSEPEGSEPSFNKNILRIAETSLYRPTTTASLWKISTLVKILMPGESAWEFEINGAERSKSYYHFYSFRSSKYFQIDHILIKGRIPWDICRKYRKKNYNFPLHFPNEEFKDYALRFIYGLVRKKAISFLRLIKWDFRRMK